MISLVTPFPFLLDFAFFAPLILRLGISLFLLTNLVKPNTSHIAYRGLFFVLGLSILLGVGVQISAIILTLVLLASFISSKAGLPFQLTKNETILLTLITLSLVLTGAGPFAFDLPL